MGLADQARKAWGRITGQASPEPKHDAPKPTEPPKTAAVPVRPALKQVSTMEAVRGKEGSPAARAFPEYRPQIKEALHRSVQKPQPEQPAKPVEREPTKLQPKLQPPRTPGPGPSMNSPNVKFVSRTSTAAKAPAPATQAKSDVGSHKPPPKPRKSLNDYERKDKDAADKQKSADQQRPGRKTVEQYSRSSGKDQGKDISR